MKTMNLVSLIVLLLVADLFAHPGGLNSSGGHYNRKTGVYHCHRCPCGCEESSRQLKSASPVAPHIERDSQGRILRSEKARNEFMREHPCPSTGKTSGACPGYIVDHIIPLKHGGMDEPFNMQWQTIEEAKEKDQWE